MWFFVGLVVLVVLWAVSPAIPILIVIVGFVYIAFFTGGSGDPASNVKRGKWPPKKRSKAKLREMRKKMGKGI